MISLPILDSSENELFVSNLLPTSIDTDKNQITAIPSEIGLMGNLEKLWLRK